ncbi:MAG: hypothetical protein HZB26_11475 [Candidatus Hydrogenedentes bacterium]|nr:hypothetical protein [Candidatus Hydrogenedentota bacterium]
MGIQVRIDRAKESLIRLQAAFDRFAAPNGRASTPGAPQRVLVIEICEGNLWKCVAGTIGSEEATVSSARTLVMAGDGGAEHSAELRRLAEGALVVAVSNSDKSVCRILDIVDATPEQTRQMAALRLETELPYPVSESLWTCERQNGAHANGGGKVLVVATPQAEARDLEAALRAKGLRCDGIEYDAGAVSELVRASESTNAAVALAWFRPSQITLVVTQGGVPRYVRRIGMPQEQDSGSAAQGTWRLLAANEVRQSLYDYWMRTNGQPPERLIVVGTSADDAGFTESFKANGNYPVELGIRPKGITAPDPAAIQGDLFSDYLACVGALSSLHRRRRGASTAVPALRSADRSSTRIDFRNRRPLLILANAILIVVVAAAMFGVRAYRLHRAEDIISEMKPLVSDLGRLQEEVDILQSQSARQRSISDILLTLSDAFPSDVTVETITVSPEGKIMIKGKTKSVAAASEKAVSAMTASGAFAKCTFLGATKDKDDFVFQISCELSKGQGKAKR